MALSLDPITGLPADFLAPDLYQIPLNSRPQLAPEWSPDHLPPNALHPDNMPSMFATVQAQNSLNPELPQALTTDGKGNLNVNAIGGGGGGGGAAYGATGSDSNWATATSHAFDQGVAIGSAYTTIWRLSYTCALDVASVNVNQPIVVVVQVKGRPGNVEYLYDTILMIQRPIGTSLNVVDVQTKDFLYAGGWKQPPWWSPGDRFLEVHFQCSNGDLIAVGASMDYS